MASTSTSAKNLKVGIASSVAKSYGYSWARTLEAASRLDVTLVQLYLPVKPLDLKNQLDIFNLSQNIGFEFYFHLPHFLDTTLLTKYKNMMAGYFTNSLLIIHEQDINQNIFDASEELNLNVGLENDSKTEEIDSYCNLINRALKSGIHLTAVFDYSRFYIQLVQKYSENEIEKHALDIIRLCQDNAISMVFHVIDHDDNKGLRENWKVLFDGKLFWKDLISFALKESDVLKSLIFEYEDYYYTEQSLNRLRGWIKKL